MIFYLALFIGLVVGCTLTPKELGFSLDEESFQETY